MAEKWIQKAVPESHKGLLHKNLGIPQGQKIPRDTLEEAAKKPGKIGQRARFALTLRKMS